jgi:hypothetical protein
MEHLLFSLLVEDRPPSPVLQLTDPDGQRSPLTEQTNQLPIDPIDAPTQRRKRSPGMLV